mgnify:FL=1
MENLNEKMKDVGLKIKDATDTVILTGMEAKDTLDEKVILKVLKNNAGLFQKNKRFIFN